MMRPKLVQRFALKWTIGNNALSFRSIDNFPRFTDPFVRREFFTEELCQFLAAPNPFHENGLEGQWREDSRHKSEIRFSARWEILDCRLLNAKQSEQFTLKMKAGQFVRYWMPAIVWMMLIFAGSSDVLSDTNTSRFIVPFLHWLYPQISNEAVNIINIGIRKFGHVSEYLILAILLWRAFQQGANWKARLSILFVATLLGCAAFAAGDEFHQSFVPTRTPSPLDVLIDICGALVGVVICVAVASRKGLKQKRA